MHLRTGARCGVQKDPTERVASKRGLPGERILLVRWPRVFEATGHAPGQRIGLVQWPRVFEATGQAPSERF